MNPCAENAGPVRLVRVSRWFENGRSGRPVLDSVSFSAASGRLHLFLGPSGSGKTTLLTMMAGLQRPTSGEVILFGHSLAGYSSAALQELRARCIGFVFQDFQLIDSLDVFHNISLVLRFARTANGDMRRTVEGLLERFDIAQLRDRRPAQLSQGEKQRVAVARAVANRAGLVIADEPTASLESAQGLAVIQLLRDYAHEQGRCVIVASHDLRLAECADTVHWLDDGCLRPWNGSAAAPGMLGASTRRRGSDLVRVSEVAAAGEVARS